MARKRSQTSPAPKTTYLTGLAEAAAHRKLQKLYDELLLPYGLSKNQWLIVGLVLDAGKTGARISELAEQAGCSLPYLTNTINVLEARNILARKADADDSRSKYVSIRRSYVPTAKKIEKNLQKSLEQSAFSNVTASDYKAYLRVLAHLQDGLA